MFDAYYIIIKEGLFYLCSFVIFVFQPGFVVFVASVVFVGVWLLWLYHALPIYLSIQSNLIYPNLILSYLILSECILSYLIYLVYLNNLKYLCKVSLKKTKVSF